MLLTLYGVAYCGGSQFVALALAQSQPSGQNPTSYLYWVQWGVIGVMAFLLMSGKFLSPRYVLDRETARADRMEAALATLNDRMAEKLLPALEQSRTASTASQQALQQAMQLFRDIQRDQERDARGA